MADTRALLSRIAAFRERLEQITPALPAEGPADAGAVVAALSARPVAVPPAPPPSLTNRARRLLEDARGLIAQQRGLTDDPLVSADPADPLAKFARGTVGLTDAAVRLVQTFPTAADAQLRLCDGLEQLLVAVRERLGILDQAVTARRTDTVRIATLAELLLALDMGRPVTLEPFVALAESLLADARAGLPIRFLAADQPSPAFCVAAHALTVAQVAARLAPQDYEWASRPELPVVAALLMDIGMLRVPADIFTQPGPLTADQKRAVENHPRTGAELLCQRLPEAAAAIDGVVAHHERLDGTGYPNGLNGDSLPPLGRFLAACDAYAAMCSRRPHRDALDPRTALTDCLLMADEGTLDRDFAEYLLSLSFHPTGTVVELADGRTAVVVANHPARSNLRVASRPVVAVLADADDRVLPRPEVIDLAAADRGGVLRAVPTDRRRGLLAESYPDLAR